MMTVLWKLDMKIYFYFHMAVLVIVCIYLQHLFWAGLEGIFQVNFSKFLQNKFFGEVWGLEKIPCSMTFASVVVAVTYCDYYY